MRRAMISLDVAALCNDSERLEVKPGFETRALRENREGLIVSKNRWPESARVRYSRADPDV